MSLRVQKNTGADVAATVRMTPCEVGREGGEVAVCEVGRPFATWSLGEFEVALNCMMNACAGESVMMRA